MGDYRRVWRFDGATNKWEQRSGPNPVVKIQSGKTVVPA